MKKIIFNKKKYCTTVKMLFIFVLFASCSSLNKSTNNTSVPADLVQQYYLINGINKYFQGDLMQAHESLAASISTYPNCAACYYALSNVLSKAGLMNDALNTGKMAFKLDSTNFWYGKHLAYVSDIGGNIGQATKTYEYLLDNFKNSKDEDIVFNLGSLYYRQNKFDKALQLYDSLQKAKGFDERILFARQQIYYATNNSSAALVEALRYFESNKENPQANVLLAEVFARNGKDSIALGYFERAHAMDGDYAAPLFGLAEMYRKGYEYDKFFDILDKIAINKSIPLKDKIEYFSPALQFWSQVSYRDKIENLFVLLAENYDNSWAFRQFYAAFLMQTERQDEAMKIVNDELNQNKANVNALDMKVAMLYYARDLENILPVIDTALVYSADKYSLLLQKSSVLYELKKYQEAIPILENLLKNEQNVERRNNIMSFLGDVYHAADNKKMAYKMYKNVIKTDTNNVGVLNNYAYYLSEDNKNLEQALEMSKKTVDAEPENATFLDTYAWILHKLGRSAEAKTVFRRAMNCGGRESTVILEHYGDVLFELKEYDTAILYWEDSLPKSDAVNAEKIKVKIDKCKEIKNKK